MLYYFLSLITVCLIALCCKYAYQAGHRAGKKEQAPLTLRGKDLVAMAHTENYRSMRAL